MTVAELIAQLQKFGSSDEVIATWEGITAGVSVYGGAPGVVVIDADGDSYRTDFEGKLTAEGDVA